MPPIRNRRRGLARLLLGPLIVVLAACRLTPVADPQPGPDAAIAAFAAAFGSGDATALAALTSAPPDAAIELAAVLTSLHPVAMAAAPGAVTRPDDDTATVTATYTWSLRDGIRWIYPDTWTLRRSGTAAQTRWTVQWSAALIHPQLSDGQTISLDATAAQAGRLLDRTGTPLVQPVRVFSVLALPGKVVDVPRTAATLAALLSPIDPSVTAASVTAGLAAATPATGYTVTNLRESDFDRLQTQLGAIAGLQFPSQERELPPSKDFARTLLAQVTPTTTRLATGTPGWRIVSVDASGDELSTLAQQLPVDGADVHLTLDTVTQLAAESVISTVVKPSVVVAIQPSTGEILAVAQNAAADSLGPIALTGLYPPGSTFKVVTASAAIDAGLVTPDTRIPCPGREAVGGELVRNYEEFDLGVVPVSLAFAHSCNTTFASLSSRLAPAGLTAAARAYGIGLDFTIPGITTVTGQVPPAATAGQRAENGFGQGTVLVTPFAEAMMAAAVANGRLIAPTLIRGQATTVSAPLPDRSPAVRADLPILMRAVVTEGTGTAMQGIGTSYLKTGTAEYTAADGTRHAHAWSVGYTGDLAYVIMTVGGDSSAVTARMSRSFVATALPR